MADPRDPHDDEPAIDEPGLDAVLDAILSDTPGDWRANGGAASGDPALADEFRVLAGIASMHRALERGEAEWGHLQIREKVGEGAFGEVFRAWDPRLDREVALKLFAPRSPLAPRDDRAWVLEEARHLAAIRHPNVVTVHGADRIDGRVGFWTEFVRGQTLAQLVEASGPLEEREAIAIGLDVCRALSAVHAAGLLHRDIKANNVMREEGGRIVLLDFGATKNVIAETRPASVVGDPHGPTGTPLYVAPELWLQQPATAQSDVYSVGVLLYFLVTGTYPVQGATVQDVANAHRDGTRTPLRTVKPGLSPAFVDLVEQAIAPDPTSRFADVDALQDALGRAQHRPAASSGRWLRRAVGIAAVTALAAAGGWYWWLRPKPVPELSIVSVPTENARRVLGPPSHDGRFYAYIDAAGRVHVWEIAGQNDRVMTPTSSPDNRATSVLMSPNGDRVAYVWQFPDRTFEIFVAERANPSARRSVRERRPGDQPVLKDWSRDGQQLLCWLMNVTDDSAILVLVPAGDGAPQSLISRKIPDRIAPEASLSPDKRFVVTTAGTLAAPYVSIIDVSSREERPLVSPGYAPSWIRDGKRIVFHRRSKTSPSHELWIVSVANGVARSDERVIVETLGAGRTRGFPTDVSIHAQVQKTTGEVYRTTLDFTGQSVPSRFRINDREIGGHVSPSWSRDGRLLAYISSQPGPVPGSQPRRTLSIRDVESGPLQVPQPKLARLEAYKPVWWPDGKSILVYGWADGTPASSGIYKLEVSTGDTSLFLLGSQTSLWEPTGLHLDRDATSAFYLQGDVQPDLTFVKTGIVRRDLATGNETLVVPAKEWPGVGDFGISPDGRSIAFIAASPSRPRAENVLVVQPFNGVARQLAHAVRPDELSFQAWSADGKYILFRRARDGGTLHAVSVETGEEIDLRVPLIPGATNPISVRPGTNEIAYPESVIEQELWIRPLLPHIR